ncbi:MAG: methionine--tRNA ligase [bacterium]|nr:methionine--tRNA ligase [bacterium]
MKKFYVTTTLPYINADPHIGFALEIVQADILARYHKILGDEVIFNTGTDEHGIKVYRKAKEEGQDIQSYVDKHAANFEKLKVALNLSYTNFIRTTDPHHVKAAQEFWKRCEKNGDIYKKDYEIKYCVGCELEKTESELEDSRCSIHPNLEIEKIKEENYFFKWEKYQKPLLDYYEKHPDFVVPDFRFNEIKQFVKSGLKDFSISRLKEKMPWGIPVPGDEKHVMYVWFDALTNYISTLGWPEDEEKLSDFWGTKENPNAIQVAGKDNLRQQSAMWQAMLISASLPNSKQIFIHGFVTSGGQKISKSLGNTVNPVDLAEKYATDALRYYLLKEISPFEDGDFSEEKLKIVYNADLANGLGNLVARVAKLCETSNFNFSEIEVTKNGVDPEIKEFLNKYQFDEAIKVIWKHIDTSNAVIDDFKPWKLEGEELKNSLRKILSHISFVDYLVPNLEIFLPETAEKIKEQFEGPKIKSQPPLFPRLK